MPTYEIYKDDGTPIQVEGPEGASVKDLVGIYLRDQEDKSVLEGIRKRQREKPVRLSQYLTEFPKGVGRGVAGIFESGLLGGATILPESVEAPVRDVIKRGGEGIRDLLAPAPNVQARLEDDEFQVAEVPAKFGEALGSFGGILGTSLLNPLAGGALAVGAGAGEASERAREAGATQEERNIASLKGAGVGLTELLPIERVRRIIKKLPDSISTSFKDRAIDLGFATTAEGAQEALAASLQNMIEQGYNPEQVISEGVTEAGLYGGGVGGAVEAIVQFLGRRKRGRTDDDTETDDTGDGEGTAVDTQGERTEAGLTDTRGITDDTSARVDDAGAIITDDTTRKRKKDDSLKTITPTKEEETLAEQLLTPGEDSKQEKKKQKTVEQKTGADAVLAEAGIKFKDIEANEEQAAAGFDEIFGGQKLKTTPKPVVEAQVEAGADKRAKDTYRKSLKERYYITDPQEARDLSSFNKLMSEGVKKPDVPALSEEDKNKVVNFIQSKPTKEIGPKGNRKFNPDFRIARTLSKDPVVENVLDNAAFMSVKGLPSFGSEKEGDIGRAYFTAEDQQSGEEMGKQVQGWVNKNLSKEGKDWFASRVKKYKAEPEEDTRGLVKASATIDESAEKAEAAGKAAPVGTAEYRATLSEADRQKEVEATARRQLGFKTKELPEGFVGPPEIVPIPKIPKTPVRGLVGSNVMTQRKEAEEKKFAQTLKKKKDMTDEERIAFVRYVMKREGVHKTKEEIDEQKELTGELSFGDTQLDAGREEGFRKTTRGKSVTVPTTSKRGELRLAKDAVLDMEYPLPQGSIDALRKGDLDTALRAVATETNNATIKRIANKMADNVGTTKVVVTPNMFMDQDAFASFDPKTNTIQLDSDLAMNTHVLLHEMTHALTAAQLSNKSSLVTRQLQQIYENVKDRLDTAYGTQNLDDFVAETFSNHTFQQKLAKLSVDGQPITALQRFANTVVNMIRNLVGLPQINRNAYTETSDIIESMLAPAPAHRDAGKLNIGPEGISKILRGLGKRQKGKEYLNPQQKEGFLNKATEFLRDDGIAGFLKDAFAGLGDLLTISKLAERNGYEGIGDRANEVVSKQRGLMEIAGERFDKVAKEVSTWSNANEEQKKLLDDVIYSLEYGATIFQVDPKLTRKQAEAQYDTEKFEIWKKNQDRWNNLQQSGKDIYEKMQGFYREEYNKLLRTLSTQLENAVGTQAANKLKKDHFDKIFNPKNLNVYFPLTREGEYLIQYKRKNPEKNDDPFVTVAMQTESGARELALSLQADTTEVEEGSVKYVGKQLQAIQSFMTSPPPNSFVASVMDATKDMKNANEQQMFREELVRLYVNTLPETSFARSLTTRQNRPGFIPDSLHAFRDKGFTLSRQVIQLEKGKEIRDLEAEVRGKMVEIAQPAGVQEKDLFERVGIKSDTGLFLPSKLRVGKELLRRLEFARKGPNSKQHEFVARTANQTAFVYTLGFNASSAIVNLSQIPLMVYPYVAAEHGFTRAGGAIKDAYTMTGNGKVDLTSYYDIGRSKDADGNEVLTYTVRDEVPKLFSERLGRGNRKLQDGEKKKLEAFAPLVQEADARGQLTRSWVLESLGLGEAGRAERLKNQSTASRLHHITMGVSAFMFNTAERFNRQTTLLATYELALRKAMEKKEPSLKTGKYTFSKVFKMAEQKYPELIQAAVKKSIEDTQRLNGGTVIETAPRLAQQSFGRVALMYKSFGLRMYTTMIQSAREVLDANLTKEERVVAAKQLAGIHGTALLFAGIHGIPLYGAVEMAFNMFLLDDEDDDFDSIVRKTVGEEWFKGAVNLITGIDTASRTRLTGLLIQENRFNPDASLEENLLFYMGGPALSTIKKMKRAGDDFANGDLERGLENALPAGLTKLWQGSFGRVAREGYMSRRGDAIYGDPSATEMAGLLFGFAPAEYIRKQEINGIKSRIDKSLNKRRSKIMKDLYVGMRTFDMPKFESALEELFEFNDRHPESAISGESVHKSMESHKRTSKNIMENNGLNISSTNKKLIYLNALEYDDDYKFFFTR